MTELPTSSSNIVPKSTFDGDSARDIAVDDGSTEATVDEESPSPKKRKRSTSSEKPTSMSLKGEEALSATATTSITASSQSSAEQNQHLTAIAQAPVVAIPPTLSPYHQPQHPHLYYPIYHPQQPYILSFNPQLPISPSLSPRPPSTASTAVPSQQAPHTSITPAAAITTTTTASTPQRILPKSPFPLNTTTPTVLQSHPPAATQYAPYYYPYPLHISPQLHPSSTTASSPTAALSPIPYHPHRASVPLVLSAPAPSSMATSTADQREQARKLSHSAIERRRREKINDKILQLRELIPSCAERNDLHKMAILQSAIDYIIHLKKAVSEQQQQTAANNDGHQQAQKSSVKAAISSTPSITTTAPQLPPQPSASKAPCSLQSNQVECFIHQFSIHEKKATTTTVTSAHNKSSSTKADATTSAVPFKRVIAQHGMDEELDEEEDGLSYTSSSPQSFTTRNNYSATSSISSPPPPLLHAPGNSTRINTLLCLKPKDIIQMDKNKKRYREDQHEESVEPLTLPPKIMVESAEKERKKTVICSTSSATAPAATTVNSNMHLNNLLC